ncbi:hypothetical protein GGI15_002709 [Coemansia interrupta]|uniref:RanBD1 domain-containing protein n=1 Tax=Coemansia interrupta TaxID=1126814 RepID=A0A9W8HIB8_9FUNG|nr:hypothetical protein GGI15_002709 [Coemansia interrupta]
MSKRAARKQLTDLNQHDNDSDEEHQTDGGFQMADKETLARRPIKVPKSRLRGTASSSGAESASSANVSSNATPAFSGFKSFGATPAQPNAQATSDGGSGAFKGFSFMSSTPASAGEKPPLPTSGAFGSKKEEQGSGAPKSGFSFGSGSGGFSFGSPAAKPTTVAFGSTEGKEGGSGLFTMGSFKPPTSLATAPSGGSSLAGAEPSKPLFSTGFVPPSGSTVAAAAAATTAMATPPKADSKATSDETYYKNLRGLNVSLQNKINSAISANAFVDLTPLLTQYSTHWQKVTKENQESNDMQVDNPVVSPAPKPAAPTAITFGNAAPAAAKPIVAEEPKRSSMFASLEKPAENKEVPKFSFGNSSSLSGGGNNNDGSAGGQNNAGSNKDVSPKFSFGSGLNKESGGSGASGFSFSFGKKTGEETSKEAEKPKAFQFGFGKPADSAAAPGAATGFGAGSGFSFGFGGSNGGTSLTQKTDSAATAVEVKNASDAEDDDSKSQGDDQEEGAKREPTNAGEEGETTEHAVRSKLYMWDSENKQYKDLGIGNFRINTWDGENGRRARVLCRQDGTEKITLNAAMFKEMKIEHTGGKKEVGLLVFSDGKPTNFLVRVKNAELARGLYDALEKVKAELK